MQLNATISTKKLKLLQHHCLIQSPYFSFTSHPSPVLYGISSQARIQFKIMHCISLSRFPSLLQRGGLCSNKKTQTPGSSFQPWDLAPSLSSTRLCSVHRVWPPLIYNKSLFTGFLKPPPPPTFWKDLARSVPPAQAYFMHSFTPHKKNFFECQLCAGHWEIQQGTKLMWFLASI